MIKKTIIEKKIDSAHKNVDSCIVQCVDPRFVDSHKEFRKSYSLADPFIVAGGG